MSKAQNILRIRQLIWVYFVLLIFEGALRKWVLPSLANPLLLVRDPIVLAIYVFALRAGLFPRNYFMLFGVPLAVICFIAGVMVPGSSVYVAIYGFRADFLHLPLIFIIPRVFTVGDVRDVGYWTLLLSAPLALLMIVQFGSAPNAWINAGADEKFMQITSAMGRIRAPATFSFILGPVFFYAMVAAFLFWGQFSKQVYPPWLIGMASISLISAAVVSGSRALLLAVALVFICASVAAALLQPGLVFRWLWSLCLMTLLIYIMSDLAFFQEGAQVLDARVQGASEAEGGALGLLSRFVSGFTDALPLFHQAPLFGYGLGMGTNAGSVMLTGRNQFLLAEGEWARVLMESGPLLGGAYLIWRLSLTAWIGSQALNRATRGKPLPFLLFGVCGLLLINGQFGQPTALGFAALTSGLCLAAMRPEQLVKQPQESESVVEPEMDIVAG